MGDNSTSSTSRPMTGAEQADKYQYALQSIFGTEAPMDSQQWADSTGRQGDMAGYREYLREAGAKNREALGGEFGGMRYDSPAFQRAEGGDYDRLESNIVASRTAPINAAWDIRKGEINQEMANRGLSKSGLPIQEQNKIFQRDFLPAYTQAGAEGAVQRYGAQQQERTAENAFNAEDAQRQWASKWKPAEYLQGMWTGNGGVFSNSSGGGWSI